MSGKRPVKIVRKTGGPRQARAPILKVPKMSEADLLKLGVGHVIYIKTMTTVEAAVMFPAVQGIPPGTKLFGVFGADGTPAALTDTLTAAIGHAMSDDLEIQRLH